MGAAVVAVIVAKERQIVEAFRNVGAVSPETAVTLDQAGVEEHVGFRRLRQHEVIREGAAAGRYYLDEGVWNAVRGTRRRLAVVMLVIVLLFAVGTITGVFTR